MLFKHQPKKPVEEDSDSSDLYSDDDDVFQQDDEAQFEQGIEELV